MKITNNNNLPQAVVNAIVNDTYDGPKVDSDKISVTTLISPPRIHYLKKRHWEDLTEDAGSRLWSLLGSAVHAVLERAEAKNNIVEERLEKVIDGTTITGKMDVMDEVEISDYKVTSVWQYVHAPQGKPEHIAQLNLLRWLASDIFPKVLRLKNNLILRDWSAGKAKSTPDFPRIPFVSISVPVWDLSKTIEYAKQRVAAFRDASTKEDDDLPECTAEEMWEKPTIFAVVKDGGKRAISGGLCETLLKAQAKAGPKMHIEVRLGGRIRCAGYCVVSHLCNQYQKWCKANPGVVEEAEVIA